MQPISDDIEKLYLFYEVGMTSKNDYSTRFLVMVSLSLSSVSVNKV